MPRTTASKKIIAPKPGNEEKDEANDHPKSDEIFDEKQIDVLPGGIKEELPFDGNVTSERTGNKSSPWDDCDMNMESQFLSASAYLNRAWYQKTTARVSSSLQQM